MSSAVTHNILDKFQPEAIFQNQKAILAKNLNNAHGSVERVFCPHDIRMARQDDRLKFSHRTAELKALTFNLISYGADVEVDVPDNKRSVYIMVIPLRGDAEVQHGNSRSEIKKGEYIILDPEQPFHFQMSADHIHLAVGISCTSLNNLTQSEGITNIHNRAYFSHLKKHITREDEGLFDFLGYLCREIDRSHNNLNAYGTQEMLEGTFLRMLLASSMRDSDAVHKLSNSAIVPQSVRLAEAFMSKHLKDNIIADDVANAAGVSLRALSYSFRMFRNTSPMQWLKRERLYRAHCDLTREDNSYSVTEIALKYCSSHPGRFANSYFKEFGEYPSETLRKKSLI